MILSTEEYGLNYHQTLKKAYPLKDTLCGSIKHHQIRYKEKEDETQEPTIRRLYLQKNMAYITIKP